MVIGEEREKHSRLPVGASLLGCYGGAGVLGLCLRLCHSRRDILRAKGGQQVEHLLHRGLEFTTLDVVMCRG